MNIIENYLKEIRKSKDYIEIKELEIIPALEVMFIDKCKIKTGRKCGYSLLWFIECISILETINDIIWKYNLNYIPSKQMKEDIEWFMKTIK